MNKKGSLYAAVAFGLLLAYSSLILFSGDSPGGILIVATIGLAVSIGNYIASKS